MNKYSIAKKVLLEPYSLTEEKLFSVLGELYQSTLDYGDLYFQYHQSESWMFEDGIVKDALFDLEKGVGLRAVENDKTGFAYTSDLSMNAMMNAAQMARSIVRSGKSRALPAMVYTPLTRELYSFDNPLDSLTEIEKTDLLREADRIARKEDSRVDQVMVSLSGAYDVILILGSDGTFRADVRPLIRFQVSVIVKSKEKTEQGGFGAGGRGVYGDWLSKENIEKYAKEAVRCALVNMEAKEAPAGVMPVVLGAGWPGVLLHEAVGHGLEADAVRKKTSVFADKLGEKVASSVCTVVDDGTLSHLRGSLNMDDEGVDSQCTLLIENGILRNYMQDKMNARLMKMKPTGNARRESFNHLPYPRMTNTYMLPGKENPADIISSVDHGLYAVNFSGGQVDTTSGKFVFTTSEAYMIEKGKITHPVKAATLIGDGPSVLHKVSMVGNDLAFDHGVGVCGKEGQSVPVGIGQPTLKVDEITVGGTQKK